jgi:hypothetical protein
MGTGGEGYGTGTCSSGRIHAASSG